MSLTSDLHWQAGSLPLAPSTAIYGWLVHVVWYVLKVCLLKNVFQSIIVNLTKGRIKLTKVAVDLFKFSKSEF